MVASLVSKMFFRTVGRENEILKPYVEAFEKVNKLENGQHPHYSQELIRYLAENYKDETPFYTLVPKNFYTKLLTDISESALGDKATEWVAKNFIQPVSNLIFANDDATIYVSEYKKVWSQILLKKFVENVYKHLDEPVSQKIAAYSNFNIRAIKTDNFMDFKGIHILEFANCLENRQLIVVVEADTLAEGFKKAFRMRSVERGQWPHYNPRHFPGFTEEFLRWEVKYLKYSFRHSFTEITNFPYTNPYITVKKFAKAFEVNDRDMQRQFAKTRSLEKATWIANYALAKTGRSLASLVASNPILPVETARKLVKLGVTSGWICPTIPTDPTFMNKEVFSKYYDLTDYFDNGLPDEGIKKNIKNLTERLYSTGNKRNLASYLRSVNSRSYMRELLKGMPEIPKQIFDIAYGLDKRLNKEFIVNAISNPEYTEAILSEKIRFWNSKADWYQKEEPEYAEVFRDPTVLMSAKEDLYTLLIQEYID
jgi:hypothetical protein